MGPEWQAFWGALLVLGHPLGFEQRVRSRRVDVPDQEALELRGAQVSPSCPTSTHRLFKHDPLGPRHRYNKHSPLMKLCCSWGLDEARWFSSCPQTAASASPLLDMQILMSILPAKSETLGCSPAVCVVQARPGLLVVIKSENLWWREKRRGFLTEHSSETWIHGF